MLNSRFCILWDLWVTQCILVSLGHEMSTHYFSWSGGTGAGSTKSASGHVMLNLCFCIRRDMWVTYCIPVCLGAKH
jgi:hypothetical protein